MSLYLLCGESPSISCVEGKPVFRCPRIDLDCPKPMVEKRGVIGLECVRGPEHLTTEGLKKHVNNHLKDLGKKTCRRYPEV